MRNYVGRSVLGASLLALLVSTALSSTSDAASPLASAGPRPVCPASTAAPVSCNVELLVAPSTSLGTPSGLTPAQVVTAYNFPTLATNGVLPGTGETIAIVDAYDDPTIASDVATFDAQFGLAPLPTCLSTSTGACLQKVDQYGGTSYPLTNAGWSIETSLDVEWAHAIAPGARILLVEAYTANLNDFLYAERYAGDHAQYVSNSWGEPEFSGETSFDRNFHHHGVSYFAAAGDNGLNPEYPSSSKYVVSVGGTTLTLAPDGSVSSETGWTYGGGGCSAYESAVHDQSNYPGYAQVSCAGQRATPDIAYVGDPNTGVPIYDSFAPTPGWLTVGGTSVATAIAAARGADSGVVIDATFLYGQTSSATARATFRDVTQGGNAAGCLVGYDLCSGLGSWIGPSVGPAH